jgi:hypothetical protein
MNATVQENTDLDHFERLESFGRFKTILDTEFQKHCDMKYQSWCDEVLQDLDENAEYNSEAQMDRFKSRVLRGMEKVEAMTTLQQMQIDQIKALSETVYSQHKMPAN